MKVLFISVLACLTLALAGTASAANWPDPNLDRVATSIAGHPVTVWCEGSWADWIHAGDHFQDDWSYLEGFTYPNTTDMNVYVNPEICETLHALLAGGPRLVGPYHASIAIHTLIHESEHQYGILNEAQADCAALANFKSVATNYFGYPLYDTHTRLVRMKVKGVYTYRPQNYQTAGQQLADAYTMAWAWHKNAPAAYQGVC